MFATLGFEQYEENRDMAKSSKENVGVHLLSAQSGNYGTSLSHFFDKNFVKITFLLKKNTI